MLTDFEKKKLGTFKPTVWSYSCVLWKESCSIKPWSDVLNNDTTNTSFCRGKNNDVKLISKYNSRVFNVVNPFYDLTVIIVLTISDDSPSGDISIKLSFLLASITSFLAVSVIRASQQNSLISDGSQNTSVGNLPATSFAASKRLLFKD